MPIVAGQPGACHGGYAPYVVYFLAVPANLAFAGLCFALRESQPDLALHGMYIASVAWLLIAWWSWFGATGRLADAYWLLVLAVWLFNGGGLALPQLLRPDADGAFHEFNHPVFRGYTLAGVVSAFYLVLFCLSAMHAGALLAVFGQPTGAGNGSVSARAARDLSLRWIGLGLMAVSLGPALWMLWVSAARVRAGGYMALYQAGGDAEEGLIFMLASGLVPGALYLMGSDLDSRWLRRLGWGTVVTFSAGVLALGTRAAFFQNMMALLWLRHYGVRPIGKAAWGGLIAGGLLLSTAVFGAREAAMRAEAKQGSHAADEDRSPGLGAALNEMGTSIMTVVYTLDLVPSVRDFAWGESYLASVAAVVPGLTADRETEENWLTYMVSPEATAIGGGLGFSFIAEAYLNFGIGAPVALGLAGFLLGRFAGWSHAGRRSGRLAFAACVISIMLFSARASSLSFVRRVLVLCVMPYVALALLHILEIRSSGGMKEPAKTLD